MARAWFVVATAVLLLPGVVAAPNTTLEASFASDFMTLTVHKDSVVTGKAAVDLRRTIDEQGDVDGTVTEREVAAFLERFSGLMSSAMSGELTTRMTLDGGAPTQGRVADFDILDGAGRVNSDAAAKMTGKLTATFVPGPGPTHSFVLEGDSANDTSRIALRPPAGYRISSVEGITDYDLDSAGRKLEYEGTQNNNLTVTFAASPRSAPASGVVALVVSLGLCGLRRRAS